MTDPGLFNSLLYPPKHTFLFNPIGEKTLTFRQRINLSPKPRFFLSPPSLSRQIHVQRPTICARKGKGPSGSRKFSRIVPKVLALLAANLKVLPEPLDLVLDELGGGGGAGGGLGFWNGFGGGGGGFDGWSRRRRRRDYCGSLWVFVACGLGFLLLSFGRQLKNDVFLGALALGVFGVVLVQVWKSKVQVQDLVLGICCFGALIGFRLRRKDLPKWAERLRVYSPVFQLVKGKRRKWWQKILVKSKDY